MVDTVRFYVPIDPTLPTETLIAWRYPFWVGRHGDQDDFFAPPSSTELDASLAAPPRCRPVFQEWKTFQGRSGAGYRARGVWSRPEQGRLGEYEIEMNVPTCTVGHNYVLENSVAVAVELALLQFKVALLSFVTNPAAVNHLDLEAVTILSVTPTDCYVGETVEAARNGRRAFKVLSEMSNVVVQA